MGVDEPDSRHRRLLHARITGHADPRNELPRLIPPPHFSVQDRAGPLKI
jgi:hypothetical protein